MSARLHSFFVECSQYRRRDISLSLWLLVIHRVNWKEYAVITISVLMSVHKESHVFINKSFFFYLNVNVYNIYYSLGTDSDP